MYVHSILYTCCISSSIEKPVGSVGAVSSCTLSTGEEVVNVSFVSGCFLAGAVGLVL